MLASLMFALPALQVAATAHATAPNLLAEVVATFALLGTILGGQRFARHAVPVLVGLFITAASWFTA